MTARLTPRARLDTTWCQRVKYRRAAKQGKEQGIAQNPAVRRDFDPGSAGEFNGFE
jgi:hypothetical protein